MKLLITLTLLIFCGTAQAQRLLGTVTDAKTQEPLTGVNVFIKSIKKGVTTKKDGVFYFEQANGLQPKDTLLFNMVGYRTLKLTLDQFQKLDRKVTLYEENLSKLRSEKSVRIITISDGNSI